MTFKKLMYPINAITEHFNYVTNVARRQGQPYSAELFLTLLLNKRRCAISSCTILVMKIPSSLLPR